MLIHPWDGAILLVHLARPNKGLGGDTGAANRGDERRRRLRVRPDDVARKAGGPDEDGVPTSYYSAVQLTCHAEIVDDPQHKAELLRRQLNILNCGGY